MNMYWLSLIYLVPAVGILMLAALVFSRNARNPLYRTTALVFVLSALLFFGTFLVNTAPVAHRPALQVYVIFAIILLLIAAVLHFWYLYVKVYEKKRAIGYKLVFVPILAQLLLLPIDGFTVQHVGLGPDGIPVYEAGTGMWLFWLVVASVIAVIGWLFVPLFRAEPGPAKVFVVGLILSSAWGFLVGMTSTMFHADRFYLDKLQMHGLIILVLTIYINMVKHDYLPSFERRYNILFERSPLGIVIADRHGQIREASPLALRILQLPAPNVSFLDCVPLHQRGDWRREYEAGFASQQPMAGKEIALGGAGCAGKTIALDSEFMVVGAETLQFIMVRDVTEMKMKERQVTYLAYHDGLTGLHNRVAFQREIDRLLLEQDGFSLILLDLNNFKTINDTYGHDCGDATLRYVARTMENLAGDGVFTARLAGDEFVALTASAQDAVRFINQLGRTLGEPMRLESGQSLAVTASVGASRFPEDGRAADELFKKADERMYRMKKEQATSAFNQGKALQ